jgi:hypothetical protein
MRGLFITLMMEAVHTSETSVYYETTRRNIPEGPQHNLVHHYHYLHHTIYFKLQEFHQMFQH